MIRALIACLFAFNVLAQTSKLRIYSENDPTCALFETSNPKEISQVLKEISVRFEQWQSGKELPREFTQKEIIDAYREDVNRLIYENGFKTVDVVKIHPDIPQKDGLRTQFLNEHTHAEDEIRFFVEGSGLFYLHRENKVYVVLCEKNDLIGIPALYHHWFDMGPNPHFTAIRFFIEPNGWIGNLTNDPIANRFYTF